jgi:alkylated DNA nucleotide flippase Atl1
MSSQLWMSIEPRPQEVRLMLSEPERGTVLKARLAGPPSHPRALGMLLEALSAWYRLPLHAVIDADAPDVQRWPELWAQLAGEPPDLQIHIEWVARPVPGRHDRFFAPLGDFSSGRRLINHAATGLP